MRLWNGWIWTLGGLVVLIALGITVNPTVQKKVCRNRLLQVAPLGLTIAQLEKAIRGDGRFRKESVRRGDRLSLPNESPIRVTQCPVENGYVVMYVNALPILNASGQITDYQMTCEFDFPNSEGTHSSHNFLP